MVDKNFDLASRMKRYEGVSDHYLTRRVPVIIRVDGRSFHTLTRRLFGKGYNQLFTSCMVMVALDLAKEFSSRFVYGQSDEVSLLLTDYRTIKTSPMFDYRINKLVSVSSSVASSVMFSNLGGLGVEDDLRYVSFDSRAFNIPADEVANYFIWRQKDATRNAIQMLGQQHFSHKDLLGKSCDQIQNMLFVEKKINFNDCPVCQKRGFCLVDRVVDFNSPIFTQDREYIEKWVNVRED